jgi:hypothetical protein
MQQASTACPHLFDEIANQVETIKQSQASRGRGRGRGSCGSESCTTTSREGCNIGSTVNTVHFTVWPALLLSNQHGMFANCLNSNLYKIQFMCNVEVVQ